MEIPEDGIKQYMRLVHSVVRRVTRFGDAKWHLYDEMVGWGMIGLTVAMKDYKKIHATSFTTYAGIRIRGHVLDFLRKWDYLHRMNRQEVKAVQQFTRGFKDQTGKSPTVEQISLGTELTEDVIITAHRLSRYPLAIEDMISEDLVHPYEIPNNNKSDTNRHAQDRCEDIFERTHRFMTDQQKLIFWLRFRRGMTLKDIGKRLGLSESRACQMVANIVEIIKGKIAEDARKKEEVR